MSLAGQIWNNRAADARLALSVHRPRDRRQDDDDVERPCYIPIVTIDAVCFVDLFAKIGMIN